MSESVVLGLSVTGCVLGFILNRLYAKKYGETAIQWMPFAFQFICTCGVLSQLPGDGISCWFLFWLAAAVVSYGVGLWSCRQHAKRQNAEPGDTLCAMAAQAVFSLGAALAVVLAAGPVVFGLLWAH